MVDWTPAEKIADAVLYEGYLLYPYRMSSLKNRRRLTFGSVAPGGATGLECFVEGAAEPRVAAKVRFLQETEVTVEERTVLADRRDFSFPDIEGLLECRVEPVSKGLFRIRLRVENRSPEVSLLSCHALLAVEGGAFFSAADAPVPSEHRGLWPVLVGRPPDRSLLLASPILLSDYPSVAPESPRDLFDGTEIDEILSLRILTLTDAEKEEIRRGDPRARALLERTEGLSREDLLALHGTARAPFRAGDRVRLRPQGRADIMDLALEGKAATVLSVEQDFEGRVYVAVAVEDDPGRDLGGAGYPGHRFFFRPEEVERL